jgi:hypothetical protein
MGRGLLHRHLYFGDTQPKIHQRAKRSLFKIFVSRTPGPTAMSSRSAHSKRNQIAPFWTRMHLFFGFPFQWAPLLYLLVLSAASLLGLVFNFIFAGLILGLIELGIFLAVSRYCFRVIQQTSHGLLHSRDFAPSWHVVNTSLPWKLLGVVVVWGVAAGYLGRIHPMLSLVVNLALSFALPAIVVTLVLDESFLHSLNPVAWLRIMHCVGWPYITLVLFVFMLSEGTFTVAMWLLPKVNPMLLLPAGHAIVIYFSFVMASLLGYVMYQHHESLGIDQKSAPNAAPDDDETKSKEIDRHVGEMVTSGNLDHALDIAYEAQRSNPEDLAAHARYHQVLLLSDKTDKLGQHAARYISLLLKKSMTSRALELFKNCVARGATVLPDNPEHLLILAKHEARQGNAETALEMLKNFEQQHTGHAAVPAVLEFKVRTLVQTLHQKDLALPLVKILETRYPTSSHTEEARWLVR